MPSPHPQRSHHLRRHRPAGGARCGDLAGPHIPRAGGLGGRCCLHPAVYTHPLLALPSLGSPAAQPRLWEENPYRGAAWGGAPTKSVRTRHLALVVCWENSGE